MKTSLGAFVIALFLMPGVLSSVATGLGGKCANQEVVIYIVNSAGIPTRNLEQATRRSARILITTGTAITWRIDTENIQGPITGPAKAAWSYAVQLKILSSAPGRLVNRTLAYSLPSVRIGTNVTIFYDRVKRVSQDVEIDSTSVLGLVMAHEIGHMLLQSVKHSPTGIMKSPWTKFDIQHAAACLEEFTSMERSIIRRCAPPEMLSEARPAKPANRRQEAGFAPE